MSKVMEDTKKRSLIKTVSWRSIAIFNSYIVLAMMLTDSAIGNALIMNGLGVVGYYVHERAWNKIKIKG